MFFRLTGDQALCRTGASINSVAQGETDSACIATGIHIAVLRGWAFCVGCAGTYKDGVREKRNREIEGVCNLKIKLNTGLAGTHQKE